MIGAALIVVGVIFVIIAVSQPNDKSHADRNDYSSSAVAENNNANHSVITKETPSNSAKQEVAEKSGNSVTFPIDLNHCTAEDLMAIDNVGETRANAIIAYREYLGGYTEVEQLMNISGIGETVFQSIAPYVTV